MRDVRFVDLSEQPTATVGEQVGMTELPDFFGRAVEAVHVGPDDTLPTTYGQVLQRIEEDGRQPSSTMWEYYLSDPETEPDPSTWRTRVVWPEA
jgi:effector-binding domain-containing protein